MAKKISLSSDNEPATKKDLRELEAKLDSKFSAKLDSSIGALDAKLSAKIDANTADIAELKAVARTTHVAVVNLQGDMTEMKAAMVTKEEFRQGLAAMTAIASRFEIEHRDTLLHGQALTEVQLKLQDHEQRISGLESSSGH